MRLNLARRGHHLEQTLLGQRFGRVVVVARSRARGDRNTLYWKCRCDCGGTIVTAPWRLKSGRTVSCGCKRAEDRIAFLASARTHGASGRLRTPEYSCWRGIIARCFGRNSTGFARYGGRGITVCDRWRKSFPNFLEDMGLRPSPQHSIDRIDVNGNYEPGNCRWATEEEQAWNRSTSIRVVYHGEPMALARALAVAGRVVKRATAIDRIRRGWPVERAIEVAP